jgi:hypothetical protein
MGPVLQTTGQALAAELRLERRRIGEGQAAGEVAADVGGWYAVDLLSAIK